MSRNATWLRRREKKKGASKSATLQYLRTKCAFRKMNSISCFFRYPLNGKAPSRAGKRLFVPGHSPNGGEAARGEALDAVIVTTPLCKNSSVAPAVTAVRQPSCRSPARRMMQARLLFFLPFFAPPRPLLLVARPPAHAPRRAHRRRPR